MEYRLTGARHGTVLIIAAAISALLASLALAFLARMRSDVEESSYVVRYAQAKIMLQAGINYVQESSRLGWDTHYPNSIPRGALTSNVLGSSQDPEIDTYVVHEEAYGWVDVRDGKIGPCNRFGVPMFPNLNNGTTWPCVGSSVRCPMYVMKIPPYATRLDVGYNLMQTKVSTADPTYCQPLLRYPDPQPVIANGWSASLPDNTSNTNYANFKKGDETPVAQSVNMSWFRVYRDGPATFIITCGSGGTGGFKSWAEMTTNDKLYFNNDPSYFENLRNSEVRLWYRIEWSASVVDNGYRSVSWTSGLAIKEHYLSVPPNGSITPENVTSGWIKNPVGTIRWIQRLIKEPSFW